MTTSRIRATVGAMAVVAALTLTACTSDPEGTGAAPTDGGEGEGVTIGEEHSVGAMADFGVGTTFRATEPVSFSLLYRDHPNYPFDSSWDILQKLEENQNVTFDIVNVPISDWQDRRALLISSGDAPDLIPSTYNADIESFLSGGAVLPISDYVQYMPNFQDKVEKWGLQDDLDLNRQPDGRFYVLPGLHEQPKPGYTIAVREDLWEEAGITEDPATWDEFADQLRTVKETFPEIDYPLSDRWSLNGPMEATLQAASGAFGTEAGWGFADGATWNGEEFEYTGAQEGYKELLTYFAGLVEEGLMDPESVTQEDDPAIAKLVSGRSAAIGSNDQEILRYRTAFEDSGNTDARLRNIVVPAGPAGNLMDASTGGRFESGIAFASRAKDNPHFLAELQFVDWLYFSDEGLEFAKWGVEGETFTRSADGARVLADDIDINGLNPGAPKALNTDFGYHNGVWMLNHGGTVDLVQSMLRPEVVEWLDAMNQKDVADPGPGVALDEMQREQSSLLRSALEDVVKQNTAAFILGQRSLDDWDGYLGELESAGMSRYLGIVNEAALDSDG